MSERAMRGDVVRFIKSHRIDAMAVENPCLPGTPDVEYSGYYGDGVIAGWIELKQIPRWPKTNGPIKIDHFTTQQRVWLRSRTHLGGAAWLLLRVGSEWLLFDGAVAARVVGLVPREALYREAYEVWRSKSAMKEELVECLSRRQN